MARTSEVTLSIDGGAAVNLNTLGIYLVDSPNIRSLPIKPYETTTYVDAVGENLYAVTSLEAFDYAITLAYIGTSDTAGAVINTFYNSLFTISGNSMTAKQLGITNLLKGQLFVGKATSYTGGEDAYPIIGGGDCVEFILTIRVDNPSLCNLNV